MLSDALVFAKMLELYDNSASGDDLRFKCRTAMQSCLQCCLDVAAMEPLIYSAPSDMIESILRQMGKILPKDASARRVFQTVGGLKKIQELKENAPDAVVELINQINSCYSQEVLKYYMGSGSGSGGANGVPPLTSASMLLMNAGGGGDGKNVSGRISFKKPQVCVYTYSDSLWRGAVSRHDLIAGLFRE